MAACQDRVMAYVTEGDFDRDTDYIPDRITRDARDGWPVEPGRYRLVASGAEASDREGVELPAAGIDGVVAVVDRDSRGGEAAAQEVGGFARSGCQLLTAPRALDCSSALPLLAATVLALTRKVVRTRRHVSGHRACGRPSISTRSPRWVDDRLVSH